MADDPTSWGAEPVESGPASWGAVPVEQPQERGVLQRAGEAAWETAKSGVSAVKRMFVPPEDVSGYRGPSGMLRSFKETGQGLLGLATPVTVPMAAVESLTASGLGAGQRGAEQLITKGVEQVAPETAEQLRAKIPTSEQAYEAALPFAGAALSAVGAKGTMGARLPSAEQAMAHPPGISFPRELSQALVRDSDTAETLMGRLTEARKIRPEATLADVGGENVRGIAERLAQTPGAGRKIVPVLEGRQKGQLGRISQELSALTGDTRSAYRAVEETMALRKSSATPLYKQALADGDFAIWSPELERLSTASSVKRAMHSAVKNWRDQAIADGYGAMNPGALVDRGGQLTFLSGKVPVFPNLQFWDYVKNGLDVAYKRSIRQTGPTKESARIAEFAKQLRGELDKAVPSYASARNAWSGPSKYMDAVESGRSILNKNITAEELAAEFSALSTAEQEGQRLGALSAITNRMRSNSAKMPDFTRELRSPEMRAKISALMPSKEAAARFNQALDFEIRSAELTGQTLRGSPTARRMAMQAEAENEALEVIGEMGAHFLTHGASIPFLRGSGRNIFGRVQKSIVDKIRSRGDATLAELLMSQRSPTEIAGPWRQPPRPGFPSRLVGKGTTLAPVIESPDSFKKGGRVTKSFRYKQ